MRITSLVAALSATALSSGLALAQTNPAPAAGQTTMAPAASSAGSTQFMTVMSPNLMRGSKVIGVDVYGSDNQKIGDIDEVLLDRDGKIQAVVIGVGGFLGIGTKDVAFSFDQLQWMSDDQVRAANTTPATGVTVPASPSVTGQPATTGSTATGTTTTTAAAMDDDGVPDRAMVKMTKADLQNAPEFRYSARNAATNTNPPAPRPAP